MQSTTAAAESPVALAMTFDALLHDDSGGPDETADDIIRAARAWRDTPPADQE